MASSTTSVLALKALFSLLTCVMAGALVYGTVVDYFYSCLDLHARWTQAGLFAFCIDISFIGAWFFYKESRWIIRLAFLFILFMLGSFTICGYILIQFLKLSPEESAKDPLYFVLARRQQKEFSGRTERYSIVATKVIYVVLGCLLLGLSIFAFITDGSPFRAEVFTTCVIALITDFCIHAVVFSVWIAYKESSWIDASIWILLIVCFGPSITMCAYVLRELFYLSPDQPISLILFSKRNRDSMSTEPLLIEDSSV